MFAHPLTAPLSQALPGATMLGRLLGRSAPSAAPRTAAEPLAMAAPAVALAADEEGFEDLAQRVRETGEW